ncbi:MFS transporter [Acidianus sulfidivorans JP7]|uniref:MFS transporter n=1 Tax=Acidianus sulfidivorans JP7 TaxID=619593 RepID=A0A2U9ILY1_9CREN|nr:MFS transporter [Acidianus sulfidivorans]AWR97021.1 MFS transporter [Acidianus sulfidivorans JP7]
MDYDISYAKKALYILAPLSIMVMYTEGMLIPSLLSIEKDFGVNTSEVSWVLSIYLLSGILMNPIAGKLGDMYGKKRILTIVIWIYAVGVTLTGFSPNFPLLIAFRAIQGLGLAMFPLAFSLIREEFPPNLVPRAQGIISAMFGVGSAISLPIGAYISQTLGWQYTYHTVIPIVIILAILIQKEIRESKIKAAVKKIDYVGLVILGISLASLIIGVTEAPTWGWMSYDTIGLIITFLAGFSIFLFYESKIQNPLISISLLKRINVLIANMAAIVAGFGIFMAYQALTYLFEEPKPVGYDLDIFLTGITLLPLALFQIIGSMIAGRSISLSGPKLMLIIGSTTLIPTYLSTAFLALGGSNTPLMYIVAISSISMLATAFLNVSLINLLTFSVEREVMGIATSLNTVFRLIGGSIGPSVAGSIMSTYTTMIQVPTYYNGNVITTDVSVPSDYSFFIIYVIATIIAVVMTFLSLNAKNITYKKLMETK